MAMTTATTLSVAHRWIRSRRLHVCMEGTVYHSWDTLLNKEVILKHVHYGRLCHKRQQGSPEDPIWAHHLYSHVLPAETRDQYMIHTYDIQLDTTCQLWIVMEPAECDLLDALMTRRQLFASASDVRSIFQQIVTAVAYLHQHGIAHRDLSPENILLTFQQQVRLCDLGMAHYVAPGESSVHAREIRRTGKMNCRSPQRHHRREYCVFAEDCWALGVILFALVTGSYPYERPNVQDDLHFRYLSIHGVSCLFQHYGQIGWASEDMPLQDLLHAIWGIREHTRPFTLSQIQKHPWLQPPHVPVTSPVTSMSAVSSESLLSTP
jgi:serine/threonine protein kinase